MIHALISGAITFAVSLALGWPILRYLRAQKTGKSISEYLPGHQQKAGTPTFGGFMIWVPTFIVTAIAVDWWDHQSILLPLLVIGITGAAGFVDDLGTLQHRSGQRGLSWGFKIAFLTVLAAVSAYVLYEHVDVESVNVPWAGSWALGPAYMLVALLIIVGTTTAVAITDGLDALAGGTTLIAFIAYGIIAFIQGQEFVATFAFIIAGANLGYVWYNAHPAMVIMGDTGALALGSSLAVVALMTGQWLLLPLIGFVFVAEALSVAIQLTYYRLTGGRRIFRATPIHHHFEALGWAESQIVTRAWILGIGTAMLGVAFALAVPS